MAGIDKVLKAVTYPLRVPMELVRFFRKAKNEYGLMVLLLVIACYTFQGLRAYVDLSYAWFGKYYYKVKPSDAEAGQKAAQLPWSLKVVYGLIFDNIPILRRHSKPYLLLASLLGVVGFLACSFDGGVPSFGSFVAFGTLIQLGGACSDVLVDGIVVKSGRDGGDGNSADLQALSWVSLGVGSIISTVTGGNLANAYLAPLSDKRAELEDGKITKEQYNDWLKTAILPTEPLRWYFRYMLLFPAMVFVLTLFYNERRSNVRIALKPIVFNLWKVVKTLLFTPQVLKPMLWVYIANASRIAQSQPWSQYLEGELHITPDIQGYIDMISYVFFIIGTMLYGRFLTGVSYRKLFFYSQLGAVAMRFMNIVIIKRWNTAIGIPDVPFLILVSCADNIIDRFNSMPFLVLAAQVCPPNMENTFFALLMSLSNLTVAQLPVVWSKPLLDANGLDGTKWDGLEPVNWIHLGLGFIPLALIWMVPTFSSILTDAQRVEFGLPMREKQVEDVETEEKSKDQTQKS